MQFLGMSAPDERVPKVDIEADGVVFDLHNDGELREFGYDYVGRVLRIGWTLKQPAWTAPQRPEPHQRPAVAGATLVISGVRTMHASGNLVTASEREAGGLEFFEYHRVAAGIGELRFVMANEAEVVVRGSRCELLTFRR
jgi:hypothetical protein